MMRQLLKIAIILCGLIAVPAVCAADLSSGGIATIGSRDPVTIAATTPKLDIAQSSGLTLDQAVEQVRRQYKGRIVSAETRRSGNREVHHIKVLTDDGKVKTVKVQGRSLSGGG